MKTYTIPLHSHTHFSSKDTARNRNTSKLRSVFITDFIPSHLTLSNPVSLHLIVNLILCEVNGCEATQFAVAATNHGVQMIVMSAEVR